MEKLNEYGKPYDPERPYAGILDKAYKVLGKRQCEDFDHQNVRCTQPVYPEKDKLCFYHMRFKPKKELVKKRKRRKK